MTAPALVTFLDRALPMIHRNIPVVRLQATSKVPCEKGWPELATTDEQTIRQWSEELPNANCACVARPDGFLFFEVDEDADGLVQRYKQETGEKFPKTFTVQSRPGRKHFYFAQTDESRKYGSIKQGEGGISFGSLRQSAAYVVSPLSVHPSTKQPYTVVDDSPIVPIPARLIDWLKAQVKHASTEAHSVPDAPIPEGRRDDTLVRLAGKWREAGLEYDEIYSALSRVNQERCKPPKEDADVVRIAKSVCRYAKGTTGPVLLVGGKLPGTQAAEQAEAKETLVAEALAEVERSKQEFAELEALCDQEQATTLNPYPSNVWEDTPYLEFARLCRSDGDPEYQNFLPVEFCINTLMTVVGAICGHRIVPDFDNRMESRFYTVLLTPRGGSGKGTIFDFTNDVFAGTGLVYSGNARPFRNIGTFSDDFASARGLTDSFQLHPSILQTYEELSTPFEKFSITGSGTSFKDTLLRLFDSNDPKYSRKEGTKVPDGAPTKIHSSLLGSTTTEKGRWDEMFRHGDDTLRQRLNVVTSEENRRVATLKRPDFTEIRSKLLARIGLLNSYKLVWNYSREAKALLDSWYNEICEAACEADDHEALGRIQVHIHRLIGQLALWLAPLPSDITQQDRLFEQDSSQWILDESDQDKLWSVTVPVEWMRRAIRIAEHQIQVRRDFAPPEGMSPVALCENLVKKHVSRQKTIRWFSLIRVANLDKYGLDIRLKALFNAQRERAIRIYTNPDDKDDQSKWVIAWLGKGWRSSWKETRGGHRAKAGRKPKTNL